MTAYDLFMDIVGRYGTLEIEAGQYLFTTHSGVTFIYKSPEEGCLDWKKYIEDVCADNPEAYDAEAIALLQDLEQKHRISKVQNTER